LHTSISGGLDKQAERHGAQVFAAEPYRQTVLGGIVLGLNGCIDACSER
jgi:hypothetical protein